MSVCQYLTGHKTSVSRFHLNCFKIKNRSNSREYVCVYSVLHDTCLSPFKQPGVETGAADSCVPLSKHNTCHCHKLPPPPLLWTVATFLQMSTIWCRNVPKQARKMPHKPCCCWYRSDWLSLVLTSSVNPHPWAPHRAVRPKGQISSFYGSLDSAEGFQTVVGSPLDASPCLTLEMCPLLCGYPPLTLFTRHPHPLLCEDSYAYFIWPFEQHRLLK